MSAAPVVAARAVSAPGKGIPGGEQGWIGQQTPGKWSIRISLYILYYTYMSFLLFHGEIPRIAIPTPAPQALPMLLLAGRLFIRAISMFTPGSVRAKAMFQ
jgi:hypothetical protein